MARHRSLLKFEKERSTNSRLVIKIYSVSSTISSGHFVILTLNSSLFVGDFTQNWFSDDCYVHHTLTGIVLATMLCLAFLLRNSRQFSSDNQALTSKCDINSITIAYN